MTLSPFSIAHIPALTLSLSKGVAANADRPKGFDRLSLSALFNAGAMNVSEARNG